ncbi:response regulator [Candidatus Kaiserbacteria bacterium]|nr:MAG: response regulator [Candidatus Kaiserbacteria bacterium]
MSDETTKTQISYSVLLVDDDDFLLDMYALKFSQAGHTIQSAQGAEIALEKLRNSGYSPDAVVLDLVMPKMDGFELLEHIKEEGLAPKAALIVLSNQGEPENLVRAKELGASSHIIKANAIPSEVLAMVEDIIESR